MATMRGLESARRALFEPVDIASLAVFRIMFGAVMMWEVFRYLDHDWVRRYYIRPSFHFNYYGFGWVEPWPGDGMYVHFYVLGVLALAIFLGLFYRVATVLFFLGFTYVMLLDQTQYLNHFYLISLVSLLLVFVPAHRSLSLDARLRPGLGREWAPAWALWLLRGQMAVVYVYGGLAKITPDWLRGYPIGAWLRDRADLPLFGWAFEYPGVVLLFAYGGLFLDLLVVPALLWRRTRWFALGAAVFFHWLNANLFQIGIFPWFAIAATLLFLPPDWPRKVFNWPRTVDSPAAAPQRPLVWGLFVAYFAIQLLMPLRHFAYPGSVHWTEEGHRFAWHMKLRDKEAEVRFHVLDPETSREEVVRPERYLTRRQARKMATRPDMVLQFAHYLADRHELDHGRRPEVRVTCIASLNGRKPQLLVDPTVDLAAEARNLLPAAWILPLQHPLDPTTGYGPRAG